jgi:hypothetical protein
VLLVVAGCSDSATTTNASPGVTTTTPTSIAPTTDPASTTTATVQTTVPPSITRASTTTEPESTTTDLPGEPTEHFFFKQGDVLGVIGVASTDVLNVRAAPGIDQEIVARLDPLAQGIVVTGPARSLSASLWIEVEFTGGRGWVNSGFLAYIGLTNDVTAQVVNQLGEIPRAETMLDLGALVATTRASEDPPSTITVSAGPLVGDLGEVTYDVVGLGDDSVLGERLHVFGQPLVSGEGFELKSVEGTALCGRAVTSDGLCV